MERNNEINELIARLLINDLNEEEHALVVAWINASEENQRYFINIKNAWQLTAVKLTEQVNEDVEWNKFRENISARDANVVPIHKRSNGVIFRRVLRVGVAAALLLAIGLSWLYKNKNGQQRSVVKKTENKKESVATVWQHEVNTTGKERKIMLADGSLVVLFNNSELVFEKHFIERYIKLTGKAFFKVAKNASRPFSVESDAITTTALGTEFTVDAYKTKKQITVRLYNGRVVIQPLATTNNLLKNDVYLLPGQEFVYGPLITLVRSFGAGGNQEPVVKKEEEEVMPNDNPMLPVNKSGSWRMYNNQALSQVFDHLASSYGVTVVYDTKDVQQKYFVGQFRTTDSIEMILNLITKANKLKCTREDNTYIIHQ
ncbi:MULTISPECIES: FecR family protein [Niastella]|uniref:FecR family protein n=1 Tax=Niastella soli TaxID=2821487 RepID=A0ABS3YVC2_9BACT|nr:FecR family protein [Niastella soli]MBO9201860.1 FecR family protein [Niastella soli]